MRFSVLAPLPRSVLCALPLSSLGLKGFCTHCLVLSAVTLVLSGCGGAAGQANESASTANVVPQVVIVANPNAPVTDSAAPTPSADSGGGVVVSTPVVLTVQADAGMLLLLLPDGQDMAAAGVTAWVDAASEVGVRVYPLTDAQFLGLGEVAHDFAGLILPDGLHAQASDAIVKAVSDYTQSGGHTMLVYDFAALKLVNGVPVYPIPKSRLSALAGVDYVLYDALRDRTTGLGPVTATRSTMRALQVPPGKSLPYVDPSPSTPVVAPVMASSTTLPASSAPLLSAVQTTAQTALYLPVSTTDSGGVKGFDPQQYANLRYAGSAMGKARRTVKINLGRAIQAKPVEASKVSLASRTSSSGGAVQPMLMASSASAAPPPDPLETYTGYLLGPLIYPSYVTQGDFGALTGQKVLATSAQFGLVAGINPVGAGEVLFVNLPLTYLKTRTDALMMHGFLNYFARNMLGMAHLSSMPNGVGGMTLDWHLDAKAAQTPTANLMKLHVFDDPQALFSIEMTAGPDAITVGDQRGWDLSSNPIAQQYLKTFLSAGHSVGSHGGWNHDGYGSSATEANMLSSTGGMCADPLSLQDNFLQCLVLNRRAVDTATGSASRSYSAPEGNNPLWAMDWLEKQGVVSAYFAGHTGLGATRQYRDGQLRNPGVWVFPVTPAGLYATFEEFQDYNVPAADVSSWYHDLIDFNVAQNTSRLVYAHPPGASLWSSVLLDMLAYAKAQGAQFAWYSMPRLADFMTRRLAVNWSQHQDQVTRLTEFTASHPVSLQEMVWRLPKSRYGQAPVILLGEGVVDVTDAQFWLVKAGAGKQLVFRA
jgi:hypothetical protein